MAKCKLRCVFCNSTGKDIPHVHASPHSEQIAKHDLPDELALCAECLMSQLDSLLAQHMVSNLLRTLESQMLDGFREPEREHGGRTPLPKWAADIMRDLES